MSDLSGLSTDATIYLGMAASSTLLFLLRLVLSMIGGDAGGAHGGDFGMHVDSPAGADHGADHHGDSTSAFKLFSLLSLLGFFMGAGWMGLACRLDWELGSGASLAAALGFGCVCMLLTAVLARSMRSLNSEPQLDLRLCIGTAGQVYLPIPPRGAGRGQVRVNVDGRSRIVPAGSAGPAIAAFQSVKVLAVDSDDSIVVEPQP
ncbi:MAG TPA: hypothetical protein VK824_11350 [Planctomycetota bacterium]|nr:hypothetical protein [Planctomycetota bacterium]